MAVGPASAPAPAAGVARWQRRELAQAIAGALIFLALAAVALTWAKWSPYAHKLVKLLDTHTWAGSDVLRSGGAAGAAPSFGGAWAFTRAYGEAVWPGLVAALVVAAAVEALVPRRWLLRMLARRTRLGGSFAGGLAAIPCLMCTCCSAPVTIGLRRGRVPTSSALAYWIGNPVLNPAVLAFLALVAPWQWVAVRIAVGLPLVFGATALVARLAGAGEVPAADLAVLPQFALRSAPVRLGRALARLALTLVPEYLIVVFLLGLFRGWLFPLGASAAHWGALAVIGAAALGTLVVIPTAGEIPIAQGLAAAGLSLGAVGALLVTLPAISLASMAMVARAFSARVVGAMAGAVCACGLVAGALLWALGGGP